MAVENTNISVVYTVTSAAEGQEFTIPFPYIEKSHVIAYYAVDEDVTDLTYGTDYTISGTTLTVTGALEVGAKLVIHRVTPLTQEIVWVDGQAVYTPDIMQADDKLTFITQELKEQVNRAITVSPESERTPREYSDDFFEVADQVHADAAQVASDKQDVTDAIDGFDAHVEDAKGDIDDEAETQIGLVEAAGTTQVGLVTAEGTKQVGLVKDEGDTQVGRVQSEGAIQVGLAEAQAEAAEGFAERAEAAAEEAEEIVHPSPATTESLGLVQIGDGIDVDEDGVISAQQVDIATTSSLGIVQIGSNLSITAEGVLSADAQQVNIATASTAGIVKPSGEISVDSAGVLTDEREVLYYNSTPQALPTTGIKDGCLAVINDGENFSTFDALVDKVSQRIPNVPIGTIIFSANDTTPYGYLLCNGDAVSRSAYPDLFDIIGTTYGAGDGSTTFNLPDLRGKFAEGGATAGTAHAAGLPNITGSFGGANNGGASTGAFTTGSTSSAGGVSPAQNTSFVRINFDASDSNSIYGASTTVQPPSITFRPYIKAYDVYLSDSEMQLAGLVQDIEAKDNEWAAHNSMPSGQYVDLTLPAAGGTLTAPADGWISFQKKSTGANQNITLSQRTIQPDVVDQVIYKAFSTANEQSLAISIPVTKDAVIYVGYTAAGATLSFLFAYANGTAPSNS